MHYRRHESRSDENERCAHAAPARRRDGTAPEHGASPRRPAPEAPHARRGAAAPAQTTRSSSRTTRSSSFARAKSGCDGADRKSGAHRRSPRAAGRASSGERSRHAYRPRARSHGVRDRPAAEVVLGRLYRAPTRGRCSPRRGRPPAADSDGGIDCGVDRDPLEPGRERLVLVEAVRALRTL